MTGNFSTRQRKNGKFYKRDLTEPSALLYETFNSLAQKWLRFTYRDHQKLVFRIWGVGGVGGGGGGVLPLPLGGLGGVV